MKSGHFFLIFGIIVVCVLALDMYSQRKQCVNNTRFYANGGKIYQCLNYKPNQVRETAP